MKYSRGEPNHPVTDHSTGGGTNSLLNRNPLALSKSNTNAEDLPGSYGLRTEGSHMNSVDASLAMSRQSNGQHGPRKMSQAAKSGHMQIFSGAQADAGKVAPLSTKQQRQLEMVGQSITNAITSHSSHGTRPMNVEVPI